MSRFASAVILFGTNDAQGISLDGVVHDFGTEILAASLRNPGHVSAAAIAGADASTIPADVFKALVKHPLTDKGLDAFLADWGKTGQSIL